MHRHCCGPRETLFGTQAPTAQESPILFSWNTASKEQCFLGSGTKVVCFSSPSVPPAVVSLIPTL